MANINVLTRRKQMAVLIAVVLGLSAIGGVAWYIGTPSKAPPGKSQAKKPVPDMTGAVTSSTFGKKVSDTAVADLQHTANEADKKLVSFENKLNKLASENKTYRDKIQSQDDEIKLLQTQIDLLMHDGGSVNATAGPGAPAGTLPVGGGSGAVPPPTAFYPGVPGNQTTVNIAPQLNQGLSTMSIDYGEKKDDAPALPYIPSGSFAGATVIEGADANASVTGESASSPMQFRLIGKLILPNDGEYDLRGCFVTAAAYGDISSERALLRTDRLSCRIHGHVIDQPFKGHISFMGKNGIRAEPVIRNGKIVGYAFAGGAIDAMGSAISNVGSTSVGLGAANTVSGGDVARAGLGGGTSQAGKTLSDYFIKRAEQYHPVIPVGAGVQVSVVFQEGFQLQYTDVKKEKKPAASSQEKATGNGITITKEALRNLNLGDSVGAMKDQIQTGMQESMR
ncbi:TrbI/VirB10 family protein [Raoultella ornithinolytica]|uniref:TrbI/VirB10 family protein n=1 Tax=Raoultella ornithinolytica TaxID=54291 RepID=UPI00255AC39D|nr:TrbI/VirB10 family protein [Raoultella ornithinolytica]MDL4585356.1 TrbI/VirB10 family protein [Raoultella ornithinolytica]MDV1095654.1 TrbI/VirB10 family protein [Raoultella ornithinolytica]MDV1123205.1 TrbI/VirB10 family protein [Raoultella ornithinolytica]MDV1893565.1 TrbI/VirB10 family protein [Raoultella ornithinolytica]HEC2564920.1 conjugal transfer protein TraB [Raoultella ornithinolytica]